MKRVLLGTFLGILCIGLGIYTGVLYLQSLADGNNFLFLLTALLLFSGGVFAFWRVGKSDATVIAKMKKTASDNTNQEKGSMLDRNNAIAQAWEDTNKKRDKLKMLEIAGASDESNS